MKDYDEIAESQTIWDSEHFAETLKVFTEKYTKSLTYGNPVDDQYYAQHGAKIQGVREFVDMLLSPAINQRRLDEAETDNIDEEPEQFAHRVPRSMKV